LPPVATARLHEGSILPRRKASRSARSLSARAFAAGRSETIFSWSRRLAALLEGVENQVEAVLERVSEVVADLRDVAGDDFGARGWCIGDPLRS
jgi:hypothetical protein